MKIDIFTTDNRYNIIYADPPWTFRTWSDKGNGRGAIQHYAVMSKEEIQTLPIQNITEKDSVLFLWVTAPCLLESIELIDKWGFTYKTVAFTWVKLNKKADSFFTGMGYYTRSNAEFCLLATKGKPLPRLNHAVSSVICTHVEEHSKKPDVTRQRIEQLFGNNIRKIELFARQAVDGWDCWGNEAPEN